MAGTSVTGKGLGSSGKITTTELSILANGPAIMAIGSVSTENLEVTPSPPDQYPVVVTLPYPLPVSNNYVIFLSAEGDATAYVADMSDDDDNNLTGFTIVCDSETTINYIVARKGFRAP